MNVKFYVIVFMLMVLGLSLSIEAHQQPCSMLPVYHVLQLPTRGLAWLPEEDLNGNCPMVAEGEWIHAPSGNHHLMVFAAGPAGSGHYWAITVAVQNRNEHAEAHGICLTTNTVGWRTLQQFNHKPLPWIDDIDKDGNPEIILWTSFPLREEPGSMDFGLMGWVYTLSSENTLRVDLPLSRKIAQELVKEYQKPIRTSEAILTNRNKAAKALESFASGSCIINE